MSLADHHKETWNAIKSLNKKLEPVSFLIPPVVLQELEAQLNSRYTEKKRLCNIVFEKLSTRKWSGFDVYDLAPVDHGISEQMSAKLRRRQLLPDEERNDAFLVAESSIKEASYLLTRDSHLLNMDRLEYRKVIKEYTLEPPQIISPVQAVQLKI